MFSLASAIILGSAIIGFPLLLSAAANQRFIAYMMQRDAAYDRLHATFIADLARKSGLEPPIK